jgi:hypothetical protein
MTPLILVVGAPRSGTTWVQSLLGAQPGVVTPQETDVFTRYIRPLHDAWQWQQRGGPEDWARRRFKGLPGVMTTDEYTALVRGLIDDILGAVIAVAAPGADGAVDMAAVVEKSPAHSTCAEVIATYVPDAKVIHVVRDGRDVAASLNAASAGWGRGWAPRTVDGGAQMWVDHVRGAREYPEMGVAYHEVRYETLVTSDVAALQELFAFCGFAVNAGECERRYEAARFDVMAGGEHDPVTIGGDFAPYAATRTEPEGFFRTGANGGWRAAWSPSDRLEFDRVGGPLLRELGYETDPSWAADARHTRAFHATATARRVVGGAARRIGRIGEQIAGDS